MIIVVLSMGIISSQVFSQTDIIQKKRFFSERIDSLDVEKQIRKRKGMSIEELEAEAEMLKDSLAAIKAQILSSPKSNYETKNKFNNKEKNELIEKIKNIKLFQIQGLIDWIIIIVGILAALFGAVFLWGLFGIIIKKKKRQIKPMHNIFYQQQELDNFNAIPKVQQPKTEEKDERLEQIRKRIEKKSISESQNKYEMDAEEKKEQNSTYLKKNEYIKSNIYSKETKEVEKSENQKEMVLRAYREGQSISDISRKYHLSLDEVNLILRMFGNKETNV
jgi:glucan-binding YG repeat protein